MLRLAAVPRGRIALIPGATAALIAVRSYNREVGESFPERRPVSLVGEYHWLTDCRIRVIQ